MMACAFFALISMCIDGQWTYIILPIGILLWGFFKFFDDNDRQFLQRHGINPDEFDAWNPDYYDIVDSKPSTSTYGRNRHKSSTRIDTFGSSIDRDKNTITWDSPSDTRRSGVGDTGFWSTNLFPRRRYSDPTYKGLVSKCKRNFKITIEEKSEKNETEKQHKVVSIPSIE
jgi:hypothetical protein